METEKTPQFTIIVADKPEEEALASKGLNLSRLDRKKCIQSMFSLYMRCPIQLFEQNSSLRSSMPVEAKLCSEQMLLSKKNMAVPGMQ